MSKIITIPFTEDFIEHLAEHIYKEYVLKGKDLRQLAIIFGGHRPFLFLKRALARRIKGVFYPPCFFTIDEWMKRISLSQQSFKPMSSLDHSYLIYELAQKHTPELLKGRERFASFLPWAQEILGLIDQLDLESTSQDVLKNLKAQAQIGFDVPADISQLLESLFTLRRYYHEELDKKNIASRGYQYDVASKVINQDHLKDWQGIFFCNFFYLHRTEMKMLEYCYKNAQTTLVMQGDERRWPALKRISSLLKEEIREGSEVIEGDFDLKLHAAFDVHSQAAIVSNILEGIKDLNKTVIVLPSADLILPLLSAISKEVKEFNISMGYPLKRSALYALLERIFTAQRSLKDGLYYTRDYLRVLRHPLVKNLDLPQAQVTRVVIHKIEEILIGQIENEFSGQVFIDIVLFMKESCIYEKAKDSLEAMGISMSIKELERTVEQLHEILFLGWQRSLNFKNLSVVLCDFVDLMCHSSPMAEYPFNERIALSMQSISEELNNAQFSKHHFEASEMFRILEDTLSHQIVGFSGSPLKGLQILGLFETRALSFDDVIVVDVNEGILPNLNIYEPLIPRDIMIKLNLDRLELEEEIQRFGFMRLISSARRVHLVYQERSDKERSRFIEELIWQEEKKEKRLNVVKLNRGRFRLHLSAQRKVVPKTPAMIAFLKEMTYSASSLNTYLRNPYEFYENYVLGLREQDNLLDEPDAKHIGTFVHGVLEDAFKGFVNKKPVLDQEFRKYFFKILDNRFEGSFGRRQRTDAFLMRAVVQARFERFFQFEAERCQRDVALILALEKKFNEVIQLNGYKMKLTYRMDRIDQLNDGSILVLDYKTGGGDALLKDLSVLKEEDLTRELIRDELKSFQMPLYLHCLSQQYPQSQVNTALYYLRTNTIDKFIKSNNIDFCDQVVPVMLRSLEFIIQEILDMDIPFEDIPEEKDQDL